MFISHYTNIDTYIYTELTLIRWHYCRIQKIAFQVVLRTECNNSGTKPRVHNANRLSLLLS